jgi:Yip1 domain
MSDPQGPAFQPSQPPQPPQPPPLSQPPQPPVEPPAVRPTRLRPFAIVFFALGLIVLLGGILKFIPGGLGTGAALGGFGIVLFCLSFISLPRVPDTEAPLSPLQKLTGVFFEPSRVFRNLRIHPRWLTAFLVIAALNIIYSFAFVQRVTPERIVSHTVDKLAEMGPPFAPPPEMLDDIRAQQLEQFKNPVQRIGTVVKTFVGLFIFGGVLAALYLLACLAFGGRINYWQALAVYFWATLPVVVIQKVLSLVIMYVKEPDDIHPILGQETLVQDNLGILFTPASSPVLFVIASFIGVLSFYGLWLKARGLHHGGTRVSKGAAWGVAITFWVLGLILISILTALFPGFIS